MLASATSIVLICIVCLSFPSMQQGAIAGLLIILVLCPKAILAAFFVLIILFVAGSKIK